MISDGGQTLELYAIAGSPHVDPMVLACVPRGRVLFQSDLWFPGTNGAGNPAAKHLLESVRALKLRVDTNVGGHGGVTDALGKSARASGFSKWGTLVQSAGDSPVSSVPNGIDVLSGVSRAD